MRIGIVGTGRMAKAFGGYLKDSGFSLSGVWGRNPGHRAETASYLECGEFSSLEDLVEGSELLLLAVSDDAIGTIGALLAAHPRLLTGKRVGHLSGSVSMEPLEGLRPMGVGIFGLHPLQSVPEPETGRVALKGAVLVLEAEAELAQELERFFEPCGNRILRVRPGRKTLYHLGACLASNYVMTLYHLAEQALIESGIPPEAAPEVLYPLMAATLENYREKGALTGLTGPVSRGDTGTVAKHLGCLEAAGWERRRPLIQGLGLEALEIAREDGRLDLETAHRMLHTLTGRTTE